VFTGKRNRAEKAWEGLQGKDDQRSSFDLVFQDSIPMRASIRNPLNIWKLLQEGKGGGTPDTMNTGLAQAGRLKPSLSDIVAHYSFLQLRFEWDRIL